MNVLFKNLSRDKKRIYKRAYELGLGEFEWIAAQMLLSIHGFNNAMNYLEKCGKRKFIQLELNLKNKKAVRNEFYKSQGRD